MNRRFITGVLLRCFLYALALLLFWFGMFMLAGDWIYGIHSRMFDITRHDFDLMNYCGMACFKILVLVVFVIPYLAIRFTAKNQEPSD